MVTSGQTLNAESQQANETTDITDINPPFQAVYTGFSEKFSITVHEVIPDEDSLHDGGHVRFTTEDLNKIGIALIENISFSKIPYGGQL